MEILQEDDGKKGSFYIMQDGKKAAEMTYVWAEKEKFIIDHTEVGDVLKGKGAGKELVNAAVVYARMHGFKILPLCPFAKSVFDKVAMYSDVL